MHSIFLSAVMAVFLTGSALSYTLVPPAPSAALSLEQNSAQNVSLTEGSQNTDSNFVCPYGEDCIRHGSGNEDCLNSESCPRDGSGNQNCLNPCLLYTSPSPRDS